MSIPLPQPQHTSNPRLPPRPASAVRVGKPLGKPLEGAPIRPAQGSALPPLTPAKPPAAPANEKAAPKKKRKTTRYIRPTQRDLLVLEYIRLSSLVTATHVHRHLLLFKEHWTHTSTIRANIGGHTSDELLAPTEEVTRKVLARLRKAGLLQVALVGNERIYAITREGLGALGLEGAEAGAGAKRDPYREKLRHTLGIAALVTEVFQSLRTGQGFFSPKCQGVSEEDFAVITDAFIEKASTFLKQDLPQVAEKIRQGWKSGEYADPDFAIADAAAYALYYQDDTLNWRRLVPDLVAITRDEEPWAVEFERTAKNDLDKYREKLDAYLRSPFSDLFYITTLPGITKRLERVLGEAGFQEAGSDLFDEEAGETVSLWVKPEQRNPHGDVISKQFNVYLFTLSRKKDRLYTETLPGMEGIIR